jgi:protein arginine kinase activator
MDLFDELFNDMWSGFGSFPGYVRQSADEKKCPVCGRTINEIRRSGKFGCSECYAAFKNEAQEILRQIHSNSSHVGKIPSKSGAQLKQARYVAELKAKLQEAVRAENYEEAAKLHKELKNAEESANRK